MSIHQSICLFLAILLIQFVYAQSESSNDSKPVSYEKRVYTTASVAGLEPISIDGVLDDTAWDAVEWTSDYVEFQPDNGTEPTEQTKMKIVYDDKNLYVAFRCYQEDPSTIERRMGRRDDFPGDWVEINIDSYGDDRSGFSFTASVSGVKGDEFISNNGNFDDSWNPIWYLDTNIDEEGWTAEMRIPLSQLRFGNDEEQVWGIQSTRRYFGNEERSLWQPFPPNPPGWVSEFGELRGIKGIKPQKQLEIQPYTVAQLDTYEAQPGNPFRDGNDSRLTGGLDAKIGITNDLTLDLTINPDFGQVDADPGAVALDGFEIFFQERRPFFVENKNVFDFRVGGGADNVFFSRRIGRTPQGFTTADESKGEFADIPNFTTILGAAKFSGKTKNGWAIGLLESITNKEFAEIELNTDREVLNNLDELGEPREEVVEPLTNYLVARAQKDFNDNNSFIGGIITATNRRMEERLDFLRESAYTGGIDFRHNWKERKYYATGKFTFSNVNGSPEAIERTQTSLTHLFQRVDAGHVDVDPLRTSLSGTGGSFEIGGRSDDGKWRYNTGGNFRSPELELNDIGFLRQADQLTQYINVRRLWNNSTSWYRQANIGVNQFTQYDFEGNYNRIQYEVNGYVNWKNNWWSEVGFGHKPRIFTNTFLRGGPRWRFSDENFVFLFSGMDGRKKFNMHAGIVRSMAQQDNFSFERYVLRFFYQPLNSLSLSLINEFEVNPNKTQYVSEQAFNGTPRYILGEIENESLSTTLRVNYNINPNLTIQYYGQPFIFKAKFSNFNYANQSEAEDLNERVTWYENEQISFEDDVYSVDEDMDGNTDYTFSNPDFAFVQFRSNLVVRWEYIPGSEIFLVWSQGITGLGDVNNDFGSIIDNQLLSQRPQNTFLIKATYRFVL
ncbi:carbohydrate binding family 9 domain-containing protein [Aureitalea sp. L0-47]|uniref:carbohydrate binding family 9 domain-containing protein n=1 Tax=Aureitalea sp. L0-47 TaxID=2816962 RepID=UPI002236F4D7|nr:carbohydrate binding family 9 domain-containing protein [Aureitalea sp. L0-47]MCW5518925.1 carbohydrate binding family 9 domain-containing protein [Aureitalea sp. L0-47]